MRRGYEPSDVNYNGLLMFVVFFLLTAVVLHTGLWVLLKYDLSLPRAGERAPSAVTVEGRFPEPNLQPSVDHNRLPREDMAALRREETRVFERMGWAGRPGGRAAAIPPDIVSALSQRRGSAGAQTQPAQRTGGGP